MARDLGARRSNIGYRSGRSCDEAMSELRTRTYLCKYTSELNSGLLLLDGVSPSRILADDDRRVRLQLKQVLHPDRGLVHDVALDELPLLVVVVANANEVCGQERREGGGGDRERIADIGRGECEVISSSGVFRSVMKPEQTESSSVRSVMTHT